MNAPYNWSYHERQMSENKKNKGATSKNEWRNRSFFCLCYFFKTNTLIYDLRGRSAAVICNGPEFLDKSKINVHILCSAKSFFLGCSSRRIGIFRLISAFSFRSICSSVGKIDDFVHVVLRRRYVSRKTQDILFRLFIHKAVLLQKEDSCATRTTKRKYSVSSLLPFLPFVASESLITTFFQSLSPSVMSNKFDSVRLAVVPVAV